MGPFGHMVLRLGLFGPAIHGRDGVRVGFRRSASQHPQCLFRVPFPALAAGLWRKSEVETIEAVVVEFPEGSPERHTALIQAIQPCYDYSTFRSHN